MGMTPREVDDLSLWEFSACVDGYLAANNPDDDGLSPDDVEALSDWLDEPPVWVH